MKSLFADVVPALRAVVVTLMGVALAWWWFRGEFLLALILVAGLTSIGLLAEWFGDALLPEHPVASAFLMEWWILVPMTVGAIASAAMIAVAVSLTLPDSVKDPEVKETVGAAAAGLSTFLTAAFVSSVGDRDKSGIGERIKTRFRAHFVREGSPTPPRVRAMPAGGAVEQILYSDGYKGLSGWDRETRIKRARELSAALADSG